MVPFFSISSKKWNEEPPSEWPSHPYPLVQEPHLGPAAWSLNKLCSIWVWCVRPCWFDFFACPCTCLCDREHICWPLDCWLNWNMPLDTPWDQLFLLLPDILCMAILSHIHQLLMGSRSFLFSSSVSVELTLLFSVCLFWVGYIFLRKEQLHLYHMSTYILASGIYVAEPWCFQLCFLLFLIITIIQFVCCWALCQCSLRTIQTDSNILPQVVIASLVSIISFMHGLFLPMCTTLHLLALNLICHFIAK